jgi:hypothetical protein
MGRVEQLETMIGGELIEDVIQVAGEEFKLVGCKLCIVYCSHAYNSD